MRTPVIRAAFIAGCLLAAGAGTGRAQVPQQGAAPVRAAAGPSDTTAVRPGMTAAQVTAAWGTPAGTRTHGEFTYLYFANHCQPACGVQDVVMLERGQVVDAIVRDPRHRYAGVSSSPADRTPAPTPAQPAAGTDHD